MSDKKKKIKKFMKFYYEWERLVDISSGFLLILAFVIVLPQLIEIQMGFIAMIIILSVATKVTMSRLNKAFPVLAEETKQEHVFDEKIDDINFKIKMIERRLKKIGKEK